MSLQLYLAFVAACIALALLPGPVVTLVIANGLRHGTRAALTNIAGVQAGLAILIGIIAIGLTSLMATLGYWFDWVRFAGAAYLVWLGVKLIRAPVEAVDADKPPPPPRGGFFAQGFLVALSNPKLFARDRQVCAYCLGHFHLDDLTREHIVPTSRGGDDSWMNCITACRACNGHKGNRLPEEARMSLHYLPYVPSLHEDMILRGRRILADQMEFLLASVPRHSRLHG